MRLEKYFSLQFITRIGSINLRVPRDREGKFSTELFERYQRSEKALLAALAEMYVQGVSTRKVKAVTEELCRHEFSASTMHLAVDSGCGFRPQPACCRIFPWNSSSYAHAYRGTEHSPSRID